MTEQAYTFEWKYHPGNKATVLVKRDQEIHACHTGNISYLINLINRRYKGVKLVLTWPRNQ